MLLQRAGVEIIALFQATTKGLKRTLGNIVYEKRNLVSSQQMMLVTLSTLPISIMTSLVVETGLQAMVPSGNDTIEGVMRPF